MTAGLSRDDWRALLRPLSVYLPVAVGVVAEDVEEGGDVLVVDKKENTAEEHHVDAIDMTVAEANPEYPADDDVFSVVYLDSLPEEADRYTPSLVARDAHRRDYPEYDFPESRLDPRAPDRVTLRDFEGGDSE